MSFNPDLFQKVPIVGILRQVPSKDLIKIGQTYSSAGLTTIEVTMNSDDVEDQISTLLDTFEGQLNIGAGTVCTEQDLDRALAVGAQFIVTPIVNERVIHRCVSLNIPVFPGAFSPTEIYNAWSWGATMVKVFPAGTLGASFIKNIKGPLPEISILATGGVGLENIPEFRSAGVKGFGIGSQLFPKELIQNQDWEALEIHFEQFVRLFK